MAEGPTALESSLTSMDWLSKFSDAHPPSGHCVPDPADSLCQMSQRSDSCKLSSRSLISAGEACRQVERRDGKPPYSYSTLIAFAINSSPKKRMTLSEIYQWIVDNFPYYKEVGSGWKVSSISSCCICLCSSMSCQFLDTLT